MSDPKMDLKAQLDQMAATMRDLAPPLAAYYRNLLANGFSEHQAFALVRDWHQTLWRPPIKPE